MINELLLRQGLQKLLKQTESAIRERLSDEPELEAKLRERHTAAVRAERTEGSVKGYNAFADETITQAAAHWLLGCVFVRFLEDNGWLDERNAKVAWIAGGPDRLAIAKDRRTLFLRPDPNLTDRDYLLCVFTEAAKLPGVAGLFDPEHNPLYSLQPTAQGAAKIVEFFQKVDPDSNDLIHDFTDPAHGTRFLGDLYQNLSESARKRYALCQTPGFVVDFILGRTLTPAIDAFGLEAVRMIDPSCGSGHFVLAAFSRLFRAWQGKEPGTNRPALVQRALDAVCGVDLNPFAVEISRFRLLIAALESSGIERLRDAPNFRFNLAAGDSLLHGSRLGGGGIERDFFQDRLQHFYDTEDAEELKRILGRQYHVVVGNPPYINVKDPLLREAYRARFSTCHGRYQLGVPFTERFFDLTMHSDTPQMTPAGWMGMIVSNAFMKRTFGKKLIESYLLHKDLTHVIDTSGVYLPGHGTPTAILLARNQQPVSDRVRAVRGIRGETGVPENPVEAPVWSAIINQVDLPGSQSKWVSVADAPRASFCMHPWSIGGGGAAELKELLQEDRSILSDETSEIGLTAFTGEDDVFLMPDEASCRRFGFEVIRPVVEGDVIHDWGIDPSLYGIWVYRGDFSLIPLTEMPLSARHFWIYGRHLRNRKRFSVPITQLEMAWYEWREVYRSKLEIPLSITFSFVATHNEFILDAGGKVFKQSAPVIKLAPGASLDDHLELLGVLVSSCACFWLKQVYFPKGGDQVGDDGARVRKYLWDVYYEFDSTKLRSFPLPEHRPLTLTQELQQLADARELLLPHRLCEKQTPLSSALSDSKERANFLLERMIALQEELDWQVYYSYGLLDEDPTLPANKVPPLKLGQRPFEIMMARQVATGELENTWFERHGSAPITEVPAEWPEHYKEAVEARLRIIENNHDIALIEQPEYKRRWNLLSWEEMERLALKTWLLDRVEAQSIWQGGTLLSCRQLRDVLAQDADWVSVAEMYDGSSSESLDELVVQLVVREAVPFLPVLRYTATGLRKRSEWEDVWALQRKEDAGDDVQIPVPSKYRPNDFLKSDYWRLRGGLDVAKERFILYSRLERDSDRSPVLGWAGWNHLDQAKALAGYCQRMRTEEGWEPERLKPVLAGLLDLKPWLLQWHNELEPETGVRLGEYFVQFAESQCQELGFSPQEVLSWQPPTGTTTGRKKKSEAK